MDISSCGKYVATGTATGEIIVVQSGSLSALMKVKAHELAVTSLCFSQPDRTTNNDTKAESQPPVQNLAVISCGIDRIIALTPVKENVSMTSTLLLIIAVLVVMLAFLMQVFSS